MKKHHKITLSVFGVIVMVFMVVVLIFLNNVLIKQDINYNSLDNKISDLREETQTQINILTEELLEAKQDLHTLNSSLGSIDEEFASLKAKTSDDFSNIIENVVASVVTVRTDVAQGTGFVVDEEGFIVTNAHVISGGRFFRVIDTQGNVLVAQVTGTDPKFDLALLKVNKQFEKLILGDSSKVKIGENVIAIGNPLGLQFSVSEGIISAVHRIGPNREDVYIQTDAALNPGNSGGPLINTKGEAIGINNFKISGESLGFALESNQIKKTINEISQNTLNATVIN